MVIVRLLTAVAWESAHLARVVTSPTLLHRAQLTEPLRLMDVLMAYPVAKRTSALLLRPATSLQILHALLKGLTLPNVLAPFPAVLRDYVYLQRPVTFLLLLRAQ
jgi:hypothetical protein